MMVAESVKGLALCHNVTPMYEKDGGEVCEQEQSDTEADQQIHQRVNYQASSPDEVSWRFEWSNKETWLNTKRIADHL